MRFSRIRLAPVLFALICFCLPWLYIRCDHPDFGPIVTTQSGLQMIYGGTTTTLKDRPPSETDRRKFSQGTSDREKPVPLIVVYAVGLVIALGCSFLPVGQTRRWMITTLASGIAAVALVIQLALGFPLVEGIPRGEGGWNYTVWFWLALACTIAAPLVSLWEKLRPASMQNSAAPEQSSAD